MCGRSITGWIGWAAAAGLGWLAGGCGAVAAEGGAEGVAAGWTRLHGAAVEGGWEPAALALDEAGGIHVLERGGNGGGGIGRVRVWRGAGGEGVVFAAGLEGLGDGRAAMLAWRGRVYVAAGAAIQLVSDVDGDGRADDRRTLALRFRDGGFGGLAIGPEGRVYGSFGGVIEGGGLAGRCGPAVFRFEPDGSGVGIVHRGLRVPSAPCFGDDGAAVVLDRRVGGEAVVVRLLDGGAEGGDGPAGVAVGLGGRLPLGPAAGTGDRGIALVGDAGRPGLGWWRRDGAAVASGAVDVGGLCAGVRLVDVAGDWNGRPCLLLVRGGGAGGAAPQLEVHGFGREAGGVGGAGRLEKAARHLTDPRLGGGPELCDLLRDPERRVRLAATWALTRRADALPLLLHGSGAADARARLHALWGMGILARRGGGATVPGDDLDFGGLPNDNLARKAAEQIAAALDHQDARVRAEALRMLAGGRRSAGLVRFGKVLVDPEPAVREQALLTAAALRWRALVSSLGGRPGQGTAPDLDPLRVADVLEQAHPAPQLAVYARHHSPLLRLAAVEALRRAADAGLAGFLFDADAAVSGAAVRAVDQAAVADCRPAVAGWLDREWPPAWDEATREAVIRCAVATGDEKRLGQLAALAGGEGAAAAPALAALAEAAPRRAAGCVERATASPDPRQRQAGWRRLGMLDAGRAGRLVDAGLERARAQGAGPDALELVEAAEALDAGRWRQAIEALGDAVVLAGGDPRRGREAFAAAGCAACHDPARPRAAGWPRDRQALLRTLRNPHHGAGTGEVVVERADGSWVAGVAAEPRAADGSMRLETPAGRVEVAGGEIATLHGPAAPERPGWPRRDLRDLLEWLAGGPGG